MARAARAVVVFCVLAGARAAAGSAEPQAAFGTSTARVAVDFVVRDGDGALLRDLDAADVEIYEDGVRQGIESLHLVEWGGRSEAPAAHPELASPPPVLAVVLDGLSHEGRRAAHDALRSHLEQVSANPSLVGIFAVDRGLRTLQAFSDNPETLRRAVFRLLSTGSARYSGERERDAVRHAHAGLGDGSPQTHVAPAEQSGEPECRLGGDDLIRRLKVLDARMKESFDVLERDRRGAATAHALLALIDGLAELPGRKAVLLFSEGLTLPADALSSFRSVVAAASRANVSVYAADAAGLRARSAADETRRSLDILRARLELVQAVPPGVRGPASAEQPQGGLALLERNEELLQLAPESGLGRLADQTGGFLIQATNDLVPGLRRIEEELGAYYLASYTPKNQEQDGRFRTLEVKLKRPHGRLQFRGGYFAVRTPLPTPVLEDEAPMLARLEAGPLPTAVPVRLQALQFPVDPAFSLVPIVVEVPAEAFGARAGRGPKPLGDDFTLLVVVRDQSGRVVAKASERYVLGAPSGNGRGPVLFYREARLPAGRYTVEALAQEPGGDTAGGARVGLEVPARPPGHMRASSLMLVERAEPLDAAEVKGPQPLRFHGVLLYPRLGSPLRPASDEPLVFFVTAWPAQERPALDVRVEIVREGRVLFASPAGRHEAGPDGRVQLASSVPLDGLAPGTYELRVALSDGRDSELRSALLQVAR
jgi:VWFA-related protein